MTPAAVLDRLAAASEAGLLHAATHPELSPAGMAVHLACIGELACRAGGADALNPYTGVPFSECRELAAAAVAEHPLGELELNAALTEPTDLQVMQSLARAADAVRG